MNRQEVFDTVYKHLVSQKKISAIAIDQEKVCRYRTSNGDKCAIGCLIPDELYDSIIEGYEVTSKIVVDVVKKIYPDVTKQDLFFLKDLQNVHDTLDDNLFFHLILNDKMNEVAYKWNLHFEEK